MQEYIINSYMTMYNYLLVLHKLHKETLVISRLWSHKRSMGKELLQ